MNTQNISKDKTRITVLNRIDEYERKRWFTKDVEDDPPTIPLTPDKVDYLNKKLINKILTKIVNSLARGHINKLIKNKQLIIKEVIGLEEFAKMKDVGAIITCNHFNAFDNFAIYKVLEKYIRHRELYKVCREGNFTSMPGLYGLFFRHCNTLPLSSNLKCMKMFMEAVDTLLKRGEKVLIYPEQGMWWNYRKPRPLTNGSYKFAVKSKAPVIPLFITMNDSELIGADGFPIQEYTIHILETIYPDPNKSDKENAEYMKNKNYELWKECYEKTYGIPLEYLPADEDAAE